MDEQRNLDVVRRAYEAFGKGDLPTLLSLLDDQVEWRAPGPPELPTSGVRRGPQEVAQFFAAIVQTFDTLRFEPKNFVADGDRVVVLGSETTRIKATGKVLDMSWAHAFVVRNGKIVDFEDYFDTAAAVAELRAAT